MQNTTQANNNALHSTWISAASAANGGGILLSLMHVPKDLGRNAARVDIGLRPDKPPRVISIYTEDVDSPSEESQSVHLRYKHAQDILNYPVLTFALLGIGSSSELQMLPEVEKGRAVAIDALIESSNKYGRKI